jgi:hypothetical protein
MSLIEITSDRTLVVSGRGMIARRQIERGALIFQELPLIKVEVNTNTIKTTPALNRFYASQVRSNSKLLIEAVNALTGTETAAFDHLAGSVPIAGDPAPTQRQEIVGRFKYNSYKIEALDTTTTYLVVYDTTSMINHSCVPNAVVDIWGEKSEGDTTTPPLCQARLIATRPIPQGSEIFIDYIDHRYDDHTVRNDLLQTAYGFLCTCSACHTDSAAIDTAERAAARQYHQSNLKMQPQLTMTEIRRRIERTEIYIRLLQHLGVWDAHLSEA